jgi:2-methylisocitrate lyase-like PEP mutase family enzyme
MLNVGATASGEFDVWACSSAVHPAANSATDAAMHVETPARARIDAWYDGRDLNPLAEPRDRHDDGNSTPTLQEPDMTAADRRARFHELHASDGIFVMPNPWDVGSARLLASLGFEALATTSAGFAWTLGKNDMTVTRDELVAHTAAMSAATDLPLNIDSERCFADDLAGVAETVTLLMDAGAAGCSIEDWDPANDRIDDQGLATERVAAAAEAAHAGPHPMVLTARAENLLHGIQDLDDTIGRLVAYRAAGADCLYAPGLADLEQIRRVVDAVGAPVNVLALPGGPSVAELGTVGVRRVSTGGSLARAAYGALMVGARELLESGTSTYAKSGASRADLAAAFA